MNPCDHVETPNTTLLQLPHSSPSLYAHRKSCRLISRSGKSFLPFLSVSFSR
jgi:hypothetical protein